MTWYIYVDWQDNNDFTDNIDDITADIISIEWQIGIRTPYAEISEGGQCKITLKNDDKKYTPENTLSTLYPYLTPHKRVKIVNDDGVTTRTMFVGWIDFPMVNWQANGTATGAITATINGNDAKILLDNIEVPLEQYTDVTADTIILDVLEAGQVPPAVAGLWVLGQAGSSELGETTVLGNVSAFSDLDAGSTIFPTYGDQQPQTGWQIISEVVKAERGRFYFDRTGKAVFWNRQHLLVEVTTGGTVNTQSLNKPQKLDYTYAQYLANEVRVDASPRQTSTSEQLWQLERSMTIPANQTNEFEIRLRKSNGQFAGASGLSASPTFTSGTASVSVTPLGGKANVSVINSDTTPAVMSALTVSGAPTIQQNSLTVTSMDTDSIGKYGKRGYSLNLAAVESYNDIKAIADFELSRRATPFGAINKIEFFNADNGTANAHQITHTIGDRINVVASELSHNADYFIIGEKHEIGLGHNHKTIWYMEQSAANAFWILGAAGYSELGNTTILGY